VIGRVQSVSPSSSQRVIALAGGGTAGHVYPALDIAATYLERLPSTKILFLGVAGGVETQIVPLAGHRLLLLPAAPIFGTDWIGKGRAAVELVRGTAQARALLRREGVQLVLGFGGYASGGPLLAAHSLGLPTAIYEPNASPGLTNRVLSGIARRIYTSHASRDTFSADKSLLVGVPVRRGILRVGQRRGHLGHRGDGTCRILITGGSTGSPFLNEHTPALLDALRRRGLTLDIWHQTGKRDAVEDVRTRYATLGLTARVDAYIQRAAEAYAWADFGVMCAGATTLAEISAARLPALLIPLAAASEHHQVANATDFAARTGLPWTTELDWRDDALADTIAAMLRDAAAYEATCHKLLACAPDRAAAMIVEDCEHLIAESRRP
jgi:UDP-N-acetylglucosamine--N-acetylmuramyl-(pentapeptide) pyrophosphoryl-undecaprenol N-acetylglucosamine transferase